MYKAFRIGAVIIIPLAKPSLSCMPQAYWCEIYVFPRSEATFNKQPTPSQEGLLTQKKKTKTKNMLSTEILRNSHRRACNILRQTGKLFLVMPGASCFA